MSRLRLTKIVFTLGLIVGLVGASGAAYATVTVGTTSVVSSGALTLTGAAASTWSTSAGALTITAAAASTWSAAAGDLTIDSVAGSLVLDSGEASADSIRIVASNAAGGIDIDAGTVGMDFDVTNTTADAFDFTADSLTTADVFDINAAAITQGDLLDLTVPATRTSGTAIRITDASATGVATAPLVDINVNSTNDVNIIDITTAAAITAGNMIDLNFAGAVAHTGDGLNIVFSDGASTGDGVDISTGTNLAGNALKVTTAGIRTAPVVFIDGAATDGGTDDHIIDINQSGVLNSNVLDVTYSVGASDGNAVDLNMGTNLAGDAINIGGAATTGDAIEIVPGTARTSGSALKITDDSVAATVTDGLVQIDVAGTPDTSTIDLDITGVVEATSHALDITYSVGAALGNAIDLNMGTNVAGDAINIASAATTGDVIEIDATAQTTGDILNIAAPATRTDGAIVQIDDAANATANAPTVDINISDVSDQNVLDITTAAAFTGNFIDLNVGDAAATGDVVNINNAASAVATQMFVVNNAAISSTDGWLLDVNSTAAWTGNMIDIQIDTAAADDDVLFVNNDTNVAGHMIYIDSDADRVGGALIKLDDAADATASAGTIDIDVTGAADVAAIDIATAGVGAANIGTGLNIVGTGTLTDADASLVRITTNSASAGAASMVDLSSTGNLAAAVADGAVLKVTETGAAQATSYAVYISSTNNEALHVDTGLVVFDELVTASGGVNSTGNVAITNGALVYGDSTGGVDDQCTANTATITLSSANYFSLDISDDDADCTVTFAGGTEGGLYILEVIAAGATGNNIVLADTTYQTETEETVCNAVGGTADADGDTVTLVLIAKSATAVQFVSCVVNDIA